MSASMSSSNQPSVTDDGALFREIRGAAGVTHDLTPHLYTRAEADVTQRDYDNGREELENTILTAFGYRADPSRSFNRIKVELFYQFRRRDANDPAHDARRNQVGLQTIFYF